MNVASRCGYTDSNYKQLQTLYEKYEKDGLQIFAMPTNEFGGQEPGSDADIIKFTKDKYAVTFPVFSKLKVNGGDASEIYKWLKSETKDPPAEANKDIKWNFTKVRSCVRLYLCFFLPLSCFLGYLTRSLLYRVFLFAIPSSGRANVSISLAHSDTHTHTHTS